MPKKTLKTADRWVLIEHVRADDIAGIVEIIEDYGYRIFSEDGSDDERVAEWLRDRGWTCERRIDMERCWWNPFLNEPAWDPPRETDCPNESEVMLGHNSAWHLCKQCAALPRFKRFKVRRPIRKESEREA